MEYFRNVTAREKSRPKLLDGEQKKAEVSRTEVSEDKRVLRNGTLVITTHRIIYTSSKLCVALNLSDIVRLLPARPKLLGVAPIDLLVGKPERKLKIDVATKQDRESVEMSIIRCLRGKTWVKPPRESSGAGTGSSTAQTTTKPPKPRAEASPPASKAKPNSWGQMPPQQRANSALHGPPPAQSSAPATQNASYMQQYGWVQPPNSTPNPRSQFQQPEVRGDRPDPQFYGGSGPASNNSYGMGDGGYGHPGRGAGTWNGYPPAPRATSMEYQNPSNGEFEYGSERNDPYYFSGRTSHDMYSGPSSGYGYPPAGGAYGEIPPASGGYGGQPHSGHPPAPYGHRPAGHQRQQSEGSPYGPPSLGISDYGPNSHAGDAFQGLSFGVPSYGQPTSMGDNSHGPPSLGIEPYGVSSYGSAGYAPPNMGQSGNMSLNSGVRSEFYQDMRVSTAPEMSHGIPPHHPSYGLPRSGMPQGTPAPPHSAPAPGADGRGNEFKMQMGVGGLIAREKEKEQHRDQALNAAFSDLDGLMTNAKELVTIAQRFSTLRAEEAQGAPEDEEFVAMMTEIGIDNPVSKAEIGGNRKKYLDQLASELGVFLIEPLNRMGGVMTLTDVYCVYNRARSSTELVAPEDVHKACERFEKLKINLKLTKLDSKVIVVESPDFRGEKGAARVLQMVDERGSLSAVDLAFKTNIPLGLALEQLQNAERLLKLCRDEGAAHDQSELRFYPNQFEVYVKHGKK